MSIEYHLTILPHNVIWTREIRDAKTGRLIARSRMHRAPGSPNPFTTVQTDA